MHEYARDAANREYAEEERKHREKLESEAKRQSALAEELLKVEKERFDASETERKSNEYKLREQERENLRAQKSLEANEAALRSQVERQTAEARKQTAEVKRQTEELVRQNELLKEQLRWAKMTPEEKEEAKRLEKEEEQQRAEEEAAEARHQERRAAQATRDLKALGYFNNAIVGLLPVILRLTSALRYVSKLNSQRPIQYSGRSDMDNPEHAVELRKLGPEEFERHVLRFAEYGYTMLNSDTWLPYPGLTPKEREMELGRSAPSRSEFLPPVAPGIGTWRHFLRLFFCQGLVCERGLVGHEKSLGDAKTYYKLAAYAALLADARVDYSDIENVGNRDLDTPSEQIKIRVAQAADIPFDDLFGEPLDEDEEAAALPPTVLAIIEKLSAAAAEINARRSAAIDTKIASVVREAEESERAENAKSFFKKKDFTKANALYAQAAEMGATEIMKKLKGPMILSDHWRPGWESKP